MHKKGIGFYGNLAYVLVSFSLRLATLALFRNFVA